MNKLFAVALFSEGQASGLSVISCDHIWLIANFSAMLSSRFVTLRVWCVRSDEHAEQQRIRYKRDLCEDTGVRVKVVAN